MSVEKVSMYELAKQTKKDVVRNECDYPVPQIITMNINKLKEKQNDTHLHFTF